MVAILVIMVGFLPAALAGATAGDEKERQAPESTKGSPGGRTGPDITFVDEDEPPPGEATAGPRNPFASGEASGRKDAVRGYVELSTGEKVPGFIYTTRAKRLKIYNLRREVYEYVPVPALKRIEGIVEWERMDKEWRFKEAGNPEKVYTGRSYPVRMMAWKLVLRNDHEIVGHILGQPLYVEQDAKRERFILHKRDKGPIGTTLGDLVYVRRVEFGEEAYTQVVEELKKKGGDRAGGGAGVERPQGGVDGGRNGEN